MRVARIFFTIALCAATPAIAVDCHVGVLGAASSGSSQQTDTQFGFDLTGSFDVTGGMAGGAAGCLFPVGGGWLGFEADYMKSRAHGTVQELPPNEGFFAETSVKSLTTLRVVVGGNPAPKWFLYVTGGLASAPVEASVCSPTNFCATDSKRMLGAAGGLGTEYALTHNLRLRLDYLYVGFERKVFTPGPFLQRDVDLGLHLLRAGINLHF